MHKLKSTLKYLTHLHFVLLLLIVLVFTEDILLYMDHHQPELNDNKEAFSMGLRFATSGENIQNYIQTELNLCGTFDAASATRQRCYKDFAELLHNQYTFAETVKYFDDSNGAYDCHDLMHHVVNLEYQSGTSLPKIYELCTPACFGACYHGGLEGYFLDHDLAGASRQTLEQTIVDLCNSVSDKKDQCYHGVGHALMLISNGNLPETLKVCDALERQGGQSECYAGIFMENLPTSTAITEHPIKYLKADDPLYPCDSLDSKYVEQCYNFQTSYFNYLAKSDPTKVSEYCKLVPSFYTNTCFQRMGAFALSMAGSPINNQIASSYCESLTTSEVQFCIQGIVDSFFDRFHEDLPKMYAMFNFCNSVKSIYVGSCYNQTGIVIRGLTPEIKQEACGQIENAKYKNYCLNPKIN